MHLLPHLRPVDLHRFAEASGDRNPLHLDADYAAKSGFGSEVVQGALTVLHALAGLPAQADLSTVDELPLRRLRARFHTAVYIGQCYALAVEPGANGSLRLEVTDGEQPVATIDVELGETGTAEVGEVRVGSGTRRFEPADRALEELQPGEKVAVSYRSLPGDFRNLLDDCGAARAGVREEVARLLGWASYLAGMELPGRQSLISSLTVELDPAATGDGSARVTAVDTRRGVLRFTSTLPGLGRVELVVVARTVPKEPDADVLTALLGPETAVAGRVAVLTGGSRGLGAALAAALALRGAQVYLTHRRDPGFPDTLLAGLGAAAERVHLVRSDAADPADCARLRERVLAERGRLDLLVLNAFPSFQPLAPGPDTARRADEYASTAVASVAEPLAAMTEPLAAAGGQVLLVSSQAVTEAPPTWHHYAQAKRHCEDLVRDILAAHPGLGCLIVRPPRLDTGFLPSVRGVVDCAAVEGLPPPR